MDAEPLKETDDFIVQQEKALIADMLINSRTHGYFCNMQKEDSLSKRKKYMKRIVGHGSSGCRHLNFVAIPPIQEGELINPEVWHKPIAPRLSLKLFTKERPSDFRNPNKEEEVADK